MAARRRQDPGRDSHPRYRGARQDGGAAGGREPWDICYRFHFFVLSAFDFENQARLCAAGQGRGHMVRSEEVVMKDTVAQLRKTIESR
jgi:hypothetical protein